MDLLTFPVKETITMMASLLEHITRANDQLPLPVGVVSRFHARSVPPISIQNYLARILKYAPCANLVFISVLVYLDRMARAKMPFVVCSANIHRLLIAAVMVATKFYSDVFYTNSHYAKVGGLAVQELNQLELEFLFMNEFNLTITPIEFQHYADRLLEHATAEKARMRAAYPSPHTSAGSAPATSPPAVAARAPSPPPAAATLSTSSSSSSLRNGAIGGLVRSGTMPARVASPGTPIQQIPEPLFNHNADAMDVTVTSPEEVPQECQSLAPPVMPQPPASYHPIQQQQQQQQQHHYQQLQQPLPPHIPPQFHPSHARHSPQLQQQQQLPSVAVTAASTYRSPRSSPLARSAVAAGLVRAPSTSPLAKQSVLPGSGAVAASPMESTSPMAAPSPLGHAPLLHPPVHGHAHHAYGYAPAPMPPRHAPAFPPPTRAATAPMAETNGGSGYAMPPRVHPGVPTSSALLHRQATVAAAGGKPLPSAPTMSSSPSPMTGPQYPVMPRLPLHAPPGGMTPAPNLRGPLPIPPPQRAMSSLYISTSSTAAVAAAAAAGTSPNSQTPSPTVTSAALLAHLHHSQQLAAAAATRSAAGLLAPPPAGAPLWMHRGGNVAAGMASPPDGITMMASPEASSPMAIGGGAVSQIPMDMDLTSMPRGSAVE